MPIQSRVRKLLLVLPFLAFTSVIPSLGAVGPEAKVSPPTLHLTEKWVFISHNFAREKNCDEVIAVLNRAAKAGCNAVALTDCKFFRWNEVKRSEYDRNLKRVRKACRDLKLKVIAICMGQCTDLLSNDPNLAEGQPVVEAPFVARGGKLVPSDEGLKILNPSFEEAREGRPEGWTVNGNNVSVDTESRCEGKSSVRLQASTQLSQKISLPRRRYYRLKMKIKSEKMEPAYQFNVYLSNPAATRAFCYKPFGIAATQDWTEATFEFNTMDMEELTLTFGIWGDFPGTVWVDDLRVEPGALVNLLRRDGAPFRVVSEEGQTVYKEGKDYTGARDPGLGRAKINGEVITGIYDYWHEGPTMTLPPGSRITEGQKVRVSYSHAVTVYGYGTFPCMNEPKLWDLLRWHLKNVHQVLKPDGYMMSHDEIRHMGWDESCRTSGVPMAKLLADNLRRCTKMIRKEDPGKPIYLWSDMVDPNHNAKKSGYYYFVYGGEGPWYGSWEGLDKAVTIINWNQWQGRKESLEWFASRGHKQILAGYYDAPVENVDGWLKEASAVNGVTGVMYTTWGNDFRNMEKWLERAKEFEGTR